MNMTIKTLSAAVLAAAMTLGAWAAEEQAKPAAPAPVAQVSPKAEAPKARPKFNRAQMLARMEQRFAEQRAKVVAILKGAGVDEAKATELSTEIEKVYRRPTRPPRPMKTAPAAAPTPAAPAK